MESKARARLVSELQSFGRVRHFEYQLKTHTGRVIVVVENSRLVTAIDGRPLYFEGTIADITQRKAAERALFNEKERAQVTLQSIGDAVVTTDASGNDRVSESGCGATRVGSRERLRACRSSPSSR